MKRIPKVFYFLAAALVLWGAYDVSDALTIGREVAAHYPAIDSVQAIVSGQLVKGLVLIGLGPAVLLAGWLWNRWKQARKASVAITVLLIFSIGGMWLGSMYCLTVVAAQEFYDDMTEIGQKKALDITSSGFLADFYRVDRSEDQDFLEYLLLDQMNRAARTSLYTGGPYDTDSRHRMLRYLDWPMEIGILYLDRAGNPIHSLDDNLIYFPYHTQAEWDAGDDRMFGPHFAWIDLGKKPQDQPDPYEVLRTSLRQSLGANELYLRIRGTRNGTEILPLAIDYATQWEVLSAVEASGQFSTGPDSYSYELSDVDRAGLLPWKTMFDHTADAPDEALETFYADFVEGWLSDSKPVSYLGVRYDSLSALLEQKQTALWKPEDFSREGVRELDEVLLFDRRLVADWSAPAWDTPEGGQIDACIVTAVRGNPLACAMSALRNLYLMTGLLALALILTVRWLLLSRLVRPVEELASAMQDDWRVRREAVLQPPLWQEAADLNDAYSKEDASRTWLQNENTRLQKALQYAETAEQNRRQMTSNIAHELKTPLAVIHSYAEGLKEHIAEEKREKYLDTILSEAERTDAMVLELLDLSRLEAGRVKLARDEFSLTELTKSIFEKLDLAAQAKNLQISFDFPESCTVVADEGRIAQVIENFASNAVKYTPEHGRIDVSITQSSRQTTFRIANDGTPFTPEALSKVWDTFYRADEARSGGGTGLGLAIAKNIVELHGGRCSVENTSTGVAFQFEI